MEKKKMEEFKVFVGNLEWSVSDEELKQVFAEKDLNPKDVKVIKDKFSGRSKGFAFVEFDNADAVQKAIDAVNGVDLKGRPLRVNKANQKKS
jgi:heterogeneous nuclear ribonucleoprotein G